jgi:hypothetical protein
MKPDTQPPPTVSRCCHRLKHPVQRCKVLLSRRAAGQTPRPLAGPLNSSSPAVLWPLHQGHQPCQARQVVHEHSDSIQRDEQVLPQYRHVPAIDIHMILDMEGKQSSRNSQRAQPGKRAVWGPRCEKQRPSAATAQLCSGPSIKATSHARHARLCTSTATAHSAMSRYCQSTETYLQITET